MRKTTSFLRATIFLGLIAFIAFGTLSPNTYGNNPNIFQDESYFLSSSLSAIENHTIPGWDFSPSGTYYGGVQTHVDIIAVAIVIAYKLGSHGFSVQDTKAWVATHTGDLLHLLRLVNGLLVLTVIVSLSWILARRRVPDRLVIMLLLLLFLILSNTIVVGLVHTAKVWTVYLLIDVVLGVLFLTHEFYLSRTGRSFLSTRSYAAILVWGMTLSFFQNFIGIISATLWTGYALFLRHLELKDLYGYVRHHWYWIALFVTTQISFVYRGFFVLQHPSVFDLADTSRRTVEQGIDWLHRLYAPIVHAVEGQPLLLAYPALALWAAVRLFCLWRSGNTSSRSFRFTLVALLHPVIVLTSFHLAMGFSLYPRYSLMLGVACSFAIVMLLSQSRRLLIGAFVISALMFVVVNTQSIMIFWSEASTLQLEKKISTDYATESNVFIIGPSALRLSLPMNKRSIAELDDERRTHGRFRFLLDNPDTISRYVDFKPLVLYADSKIEEASIISSRSLDRSDVWVISQECAQICSHEELSARKCFMVNEVACSILSPLDQREYPVLTLKKFLALRDHGITYIVRRIDRDGDE